MQCPQNRAVTRYYPAQRHPAAPEQVQEQDNFRENRCRRNGWLPLRCWLRANYLLNRKQWCGRVVKKGMTLRRWNRAGALHIVANWNLLPAWLVSESQNGTRAFCTTHTRISASALRRVRRLETAYNRPTLPRIFC